MLTTALDILTIVALFGGVFFMFIGAMGLWRLNDFYNRMHAASKCITLGISGMLLALVIHLSVVERPISDDHALDLMSGTSVVGAVTKALLVIVFQFVAAPVGAHMLARAAHLDKVPMWEGSVGDELEEDAVTGAAPVIQRESR